MSVGLKNNNYLNVKNGASPWLDANGQSAGTDDKGHAVFKDPAYGVRAGILLLRTYFRKHKLQTIAGILARWAPATDTIGSLPGAPPNSPKEYSEFVSGRMGIGPNAQLGLFDDEGDIEELGQLKDLFFAMAAFEIGKVNGKLFKVPEKDFAAGVELIEPGIKLSGTESTDIVGNPVVPPGLVTTLSGPVGAWEKGAVNAKPDVETVQHLLEEAATVLGRPDIDPGGVDGKIDKDAKKSGTVKAIIAFQRRYFTNPDGIVEVDGRTWRELLSVVNAGPAAGPVAPITGSPAAVPAKVPTSGFCIYLRRVRQEQRASMSFSRTVGEYQCYWNGAPLQGLAGQIVERGGPGDNTDEIGDLRDRRIVAASYPVAIQNGTKYKTYHYDSQDKTPTGRPKPGLLVEKTDEREAILIHPGNGYLSSIGCLNPATALKNANSNIDFSDSRSRVIAIIEAMKSAMGDKFPKSGRIPDTTILIEGEPT